MWNTMTIVPSYGYGRGVSVDGKGSWAEERGGISCSKRGLVCCSIFI